MTKGKQVDRADWSWKVLSLYCLSIIILTFTLFRACLASIPAILASLFLCFLALCPLLPFCSTPLPSSHSLIHLFQYSPTLSKISTLNSISSNSPLVRIHCDGPRLAKLSGYQHFSLPTVSRGDRDALVARVGPVDVLVNPVNSQALRGLERVDERHMLRGITCLIDVSTGGLKKRSILVSSTMLLIIIKYTII